MFFNCLTVTVYSVGCDYFDSEGYNSDPEVATFSSYQEAEDYRQQLSTNSGVTATWVDSYSPV